MSRSRRDVKLPYRELNVRCPHCKADLLKPFDARFMQSHPVSKRLNNVVNDDEECALRVELTEGQATLFS